MLSGRDLDVGEITHERHELVDQQIATNRRVGIPVIAIRGLRRIDVPDRRVIALAEDVVRKIQRARDDCPAGLPGVEEVLLIDFLSDGVVTDEDHVDLVVVPLEEKVQQDKESLGKIFSDLVHGTGDIHDADHHRLAGGLGLAFEALVAQIEGVDERQGAHSGLEPVDLLAQGQDLRVVVLGTRGNQGCKLFLEPADPGSIGRPERCAPGDGPAQ